MKKYIIIIISVLIILSAFLLYQHRNYTHISVKFTNLRPFEHSIPVYYKGLIIGKATDRQHSEDYQHTIVKIVLYPKNLHLPMNTKVLLKKEIKNKKEYDFLELIYPETPSNNLLCNGSVLEGTSTVDIETYMKNQSPEDLEAIKTNLVNASENLNMSLEALGQLFVILQDLIKANQNNLVGTTHNMKQTTDNINQISLKINSAVSTKQLNATFDNIENTSQNIEQITDTFNSTANDINNTVPEINSVIKNIQELICNTNNIAAGIKQTLSKPCGGLRIIFGKSVQNNSSCCTK